jgi:3-deoxy-D-manno-octulosonic-acid transferase
VASTHAGEDSIVLGALALIKQHIPDLLLVLTPRHPERFDSVAADCTQAGFTLHRLSQSESPTRSVDILLGDTVGELIAYYGTCDMTFVGGSLVPVGGHNMIEPAAWGRPILCGPEVYNFAEVARLLEAAGAMVYCAAEETLAAEVIALVQDNRRREAMGKAALAVATANRGALARLMQALDRLELGGLSSAD